MWMMKCVPTYYLSALARILPVNIIESFTSVHVSLGLTCASWKSAVSQTVGSLQKRPCQSYVKKRHRLKGRRQIIRYFTAAVVGAQTCWVMSFITLISLTSRISPSVLLPWALHVALFSRFSDMPVYPAVVASAEMLSLAVTLIWLFFPPFFFFFLLLSSLDRCTLAYTYVYLGLSLRGTWGHANAFAGADPRSEAVLLALLFGVMLNTVQTTRTSTP